MPERLKNRTLPIAVASNPKWKDHLIIIGYGVNGRNVAMSARSEGIPFVIVEMDPEIVMREEKKGEPICFGDASQEAVLKYVGTKSARVAAIAISDPAATRRITELARRMNPGSFYHRQNALPARDEAPQGSGGERGHTRGIRDIHGDLCPSSGAL